MPAVLRRLAYAAKLGRELGSVAHMLIALAVAVALAQAAAPQASPAAASAAVSAKAPDAVPAKPPKPKKVCYDEKPLGSIIATRVCRTVGQTEAEERQSRRENDALADHLAACHGASC